MRDLVSSSLTEATDLSHLTKPHVGQTSLAIFFGAIQFLDRAVKLKHWRGVCRLFWP